MGLGEVDMVVLVEEVETGSFVIAMEVILRWMYQGELSLLLMMYSKLFSPPRPLPWPKRDVTVSEPYPSKIIPESQGTRNHSTFFQDSVHNISQLSHYYAHVYLCLSNNSEDNLVSL